MGGEAIVEFEEVTEKLKEVKELMTNNVLTMMEDVVDESTQEGEFLQRILSFIRIYPRR